MLAKASIGMRKSPSNLFMGRDGLIETCRTGCVGGKTTKRLAQSVGAEEDPVVVVPRVEGVLDLADGVKDGGKVILTHDRDESCTGRSVRVRSSKGGFGSRRGSGIGIDSLWRGSEGIQIVTPELD